MKGLINVCGGTTTRLLNAACGLTMNRGHYEVTVEHLLSAALDEGKNDIVLLLAEAGIQTGQLRRALDACLDSFRSGNAGRPVFAPALQDLLEAGWLVSSIDLEEKAIRTGGLLLAFLRRPGFYAQGDYTELFSRVERDRLTRDFAGITASSPENLPKVAPGAKGQDTKAPAGAGEGFLARFCEDFTAKAREGKIDPVFGRDKEIRQMVDILARRRKNNPILVGHPGTGKTAVLEGLALRIVQGDVPDTLSGVTLLSLDMGLLEAGASVKGEFERRLKGVLDEIKSSTTPIILFIDEAHLLVGAGGAQGGSDAANLMKPALARGEIRTCAATTWKEYKKYFEKDPALARRFQLVSLDEPSVESTALILRGLVPSYEKAHGVLIRDDAAKACAELADRYIQGRYQPDKAIDLLDTACARVKVSQRAVPAALEDCVHSRQALERELSAIQRDEDNGSSIDAERKQTLLDRIAGLKDESVRLEEHWKKEQEAAARAIEARAAMQKARAAEPEKNDEPSSAAGTEEAGASVDTARKAFAAAMESLRAVQGKTPLIAIEVTPDAVARVVSDWTGVPVGKLARDQAAQVAELATILGKRIKGQDAAVRAVVEGIQSARAGLRKPEQPQGVFLLVGPSGVGKTETGLALADALFGDERSIVTVNMSEFQEKHTVSRLIGSPPGYVGYGEGGLLTEAVRRRPYSVVLLDEVEKAHPDVMQLFYQVFDKGRLTDGEGTEVSFSNTIIMLTSNLGSDITQALCEDSGEKAPDAAELADALRPVLSKHFQPALLARMHIVPYVSLSQESLAGIARLKLGQLAARVLQNNGMQLTFDDALPKAIASRCTETETGARNIEYILQGTILPELARRILGEMAALSAGTGSPAMPAVRLGLDEHGEFSVTFSETTKGEAG